MRGMKSSVLTVEIQQGRQTFYITVPKQNGVCLDSVLSLHEPRALIIHDLLADEMSRDQRLVAFTDFIFEDEDGFDIWDYEDDNPF